MFMRQTYFKVERRLSRDYNENYCVISYLMNLASFREERRWEIQTLFESIIYFLSLSLCPKGLNKLTRYFQPVHLFIYLFIFLSFFFQQCLLHNSHPGKTYFIYGQMSSQSFYFILLSILLLLTFVYFSSVACCISNYILPRTVEPQRLFRILKNGTNILQKELEKTETPKKGFDLSY